MTDDLHALAAAYAVHALPYAEGALFERHLVACRACGGEVRRLRETAARLAAAVAEPPPAALRERLLAAAHDSRHPAAPPTPPPAPAPGPAAPRPVEAPARRPDSAPGRVIGLRRGRAKVTAALAAAATAAAVAFGALALDARRDLNDMTDLTARQAEVIAVLAAPDARTVRRPATSGGTGTVVISRSRDRMVFTASGLPALPAAKAYELWITGPGGPRPAGLLEPAGSGLTTPLLLTPERGDERVALTVEPAAGSDRPTTSPILQAELPEA
ncbi:anti-sigma factor [Nonomuraea phyllanthi]|uniref:Regulator of SigK n=1 Tax=Nonomuraea phyllanthi TaxID=2219224 RepID=A0A5C4VUR8_9ACTN|nr:anti-sigma factor [Nonomuraea phyllanthi]KAB8190135.1 anti-sigma factor [Nonomuraea phyllanthi]